MFPSEQSSSADVADALGVTLFHCIAPPPSGAAPTNPLLSPTRGDLLCLLLFAEQRRFPSALAPTAGSPPLVADTSSSPEDRASKPCPSLDPLFLFRSVSLSISRRCRSSTALSRSDYWPKPPMPLWMYVADGGGSCCWPSSAAGKGHLFRQQFSSAAYHHSGAFGLEVHHTFATVGSDGAFNFWDKDSKQRLKDIVMSFLVDTFNAWTNNFWGINKVDHTLPFVGFL